MPVRSVKGGKERASGGQKEASWGRGVQSAHLALVLVQSTKILESQNLSMKSYQNVACKLALCKSSTVVCFFEIHMFQIFFTLFIYFLDLFWVLKMYILLLNDRNV